MTEWQPIETAPKDGRRIIIYPCWYDGERKTWQAGEGFWRSGPRVNEWRSAGDRPRDPTHWMPLPEPPK